LSEVSQKLQTIGRGYRAPEDAVNAAIPSVVLIASFADD